MANNSEILGEEAAVRQIVENDFSATSGHFEDDSVIVLRGNAFRSKTSLQSVNFPEITSLNGTDTFKDCSALRSINLPKLTEIKGGNAFSNCSALTDINIPLLTRLSGSQVTYTFYNCTLLKKLDIRVTDLWRLTFRGCSRLVTLILRNNAVTRLYDVDAFMSTKYETNGAGGAYVYVPRDLISSYQAATNWSTLYAAHSDMFRALEDYTVDGTTTGEFGLIKYTVAGTGVLQTNGTVGNNSTYNYTDFFDIESDTVKIKFIAPTDVTAKYCQFFNGDTFIERQAFNNGYCTVPSGTTKARFCWYPNDVTDVSIVRRII